MTYFTESTFAYDAMELEVWFINGYIKNMYEKSIDYLLGLQWPSSMFSRFILQFPIISFLKLNNL